MVRLVVVAVMAVVVAVFAPPAYAGPDKFQECVKRHGIDVEFPSEMAPSEHYGKGGHPPPPPGVTSREWSEVMMDCVQYAGPPPGATQKKQPPRHR